MIDLLAIFGIMVLGCFLRVIFSDGIEKGVLMLMFLASVLVLPIYMMVRLDSIVGLPIGLFGGIFIMLVVSESMTTTMKGV